MQRLTPQHPIIDEISRHFIISLAALSCLATSAHAVTWTTECSRGLDESFVAPGFSSAITAMIVFDDGDGPALYVGGSYLRLNGRSVSSVLRLNAEHWEEVGDLGTARAWSSLDDWRDTDWSGGVQDFAVFDSGDGPELYACGAFYRGGDYEERIYVVKWNGVDWTPILTQPEDRFYPNYCGARCLLVHDDGSGAALFVGGTFNHANGQPFNNIAKWDGRAWSTLGGGLPDSDESEYLYEAAGVGAMVSYDAGDGWALYVAGDYTPLAGCNPYDISLTKWNGVAWSVECLPTDGSGWRWDMRDLYSLEVFDFGDGDELVLAGCLGDFEAWNPVAVWDGEQLRSLDPELRGYAATVRRCSSPAGDELLVCGHFYKYSSQTEYSESVAARWTPEGWEMIAPNSRNGAPTAFCSFEIDGETSLYVGGELFRYGERAAHGLARYDGGAFRPLDGAESYGLHGEAERLRILDPGDGPGLYAMGSFSSAGGVLADGLARWVGDGWIGERIDPDVFSDDASVGLTHDAAVYDDGNGPALYALRESDHYYPELWRKDADGWRVVPGPRLNDRWEGTSLAAMPDGLYVQGTELHRYNGVDWIALPAETDEGFYVTDLRVLDEADGPMLYACAQAGPSECLDPEQRVVAWTGEEWMQVGDLRGIVEDVDVFDLGDGPALYASGSFAMDHSCFEYGRYAAARWTGECWAPMGEAAGVYGGALNFWDDGSGLTLWAGEARWNGQRFEPQLEATGYDCVAYDDGSGPALFLAGSRGMHGVFLEGVARWRPAPNVLGDLNCDGVVDPFDINMFVLALCRPDDYDRWYSCCNRMLADVNQDGRINAFDIGPFVELLAN